MAGQGANKGEVRNPTGKGGFKDNPENINKGGFTKEQRQKHYEQHDKALALRDKQLNALARLAEKLEDMPEDFVTNIVTPAVNSLISDAIDRNAGKAKQSVDLSSEDGSMSPGRGMDDFYREFKPSDD